MDETAARHAFVTALRDYRPGFETFFLCRLLGLEFTYGNDTCHARFPVRDFLFNPQGNLHGGVIALVMDVTMGHLMNRAFGVPGQTLESKYQYLAPVRGPEARCEAHFLRKGRGICFVETRFFNGEGDLAAIASATWRARARENDKSDREQS